MAHICGPTALSRSEAGPSARRARSHVLPRTRGPRTRGSEEAHGCSWLQIARRMFADADDGNGALLEPRSGEMGVCT